MAQRPTLLVVAAPVEVRAILRSFGIDQIPNLWDPIRVDRPAGPVEVVLTGIGKSNAAAATARILNPEIHGAVVSVGIAGTLDPGTAAIGAVVVADPSMFADEGLETPDGFQDCDAMGFPLGDFAGSAPPTDPELRDRLAAGYLTGGVATVSTCSGTDALAARVRARTGAIAEAMEGAAVGLVAHRLGVPFAELRVISNTTGDRARQEWRIREALSTLGAVIGRLF